MKIREAASDGITYLIREFDSWGEFVTRAESVLKNGNESCHSLVQGNKEWHGTDSLQEAIDLAQSGWPEGVSLIRKFYLQADASMLAALSPRKGLHYGLTGDYPDVGRFLCGDPDNMVSFQPVARKQGRLVKILITLSVSEPTTREQVIHKGVAIVAAVEALQKIGFSTEISVILGHNKGGYELVFHVPILRAGDPFNLDTFAFVMLNPATCRRIGFANAELEPTSHRRFFGLYNGGGYSSVGLNTNGVVEHDLYIGWNECLMDDMQGIVPFVQSVLERVVGAV